MSGSLSWQTAQDGLQDRGLYLLLVNDKIIAGVFVFHADKRKFHWDGLWSDARDVELCLPLNALVDTLPPLQRRCARARDAATGVFFGEAAA